MFAFLPVSFDASMTTLESSQVRPPWWRDEATLKIVLQSAFLAATGVAFLWLIRNMLTGLDKAGLSLGFNFLQNTAGFGISEGIKYNPTNSYAKALVVGVVNTIWVSFFGVILASALGMTLGVARLSSNWLARQLSKIATEIFRNIPILLIIIFWYEAVLLPLPKVKESYSFLNAFFLSQRGIYFPSLTASIWLIPAAIAIVLAAWGTHFLLKDRGGLPPGLVPLLGLIGALVVAIGFWAFSPTAPLALDVPTETNFGYRGGWQFSAEFLALLLGLVTYTGAYIGEIIRGAFMAVPKGQVEASRALGLSELETFRLVLVPQALRIAIPPMNTQFATLIKNSTLAIAIGYSDLFNIGGTIINQSGRSVEVFAIIMSSYLILNLSVSYGMNWFNERVKLVER
ncbi:MAG: ABC transporter permease subunit [Cyanobacteria bacterium P01_E01_bin.48]